MAYINSLNASFMNYNYSLNQNSTRNNSLDLSNLYGDHSIIRSGSYGKLLKAYYSTNSDGSATHLSSIFSGMSPANPDKSLTSVKADSDLLFKSATGLYTKGSKSVFNQVEKEIVDSETGEKTKVKDYDMDAILKSVKSFVGDYNKMLDTVTTTDDGNVLRQGLYMTNQTKTFGYTLDQVGISIGKDNKLSINEESFKKANINDLKSLFSGNNSLAYRTARKATEIGVEAVKSATRGTTYSNKGYYNTNRYFNSSFMI